MSAQELEIVELRVTAVEPMDDVIDVAPPGRSKATGVPAVSVAGDHRPPHGRRDDSGLPPNVQRFGVGSEDDPGDGGVAGDSLDGAAGKDRAVDCFTFSMSLTG